MQDLFIWIGNLELVFLLIFLFIQVIAVYLQRKYVSLISKKEVTDKSSLIIRNPYGFSLLVSLPLLIATTYLTILAAPEGFTMGEGIEFLCAWIFMVTIIIGEGRKLKKEFPQVIKE